MRTLKKPLILTRPTLVRRDAPCTKLRSRIVQTLDVPNSIRLGPSLAVALPEDFLSILYGFNKLPRTLHSLPLSI